MSNLVDYCKHNRKKQLMRIGYWAGYFLILVFFLTYLFPLIWLFLTGFKPNIDAFAIPPAWTFTPTLQHFSELFRDVGSIRGTHFFKYLNNSIIVTGVSTFLSMAIACYAGYALARIRPRGSNLIGLLILGVRLFPPVSLLVPLFVIFHRMGLLDTRLSLILPYTALNIPLATWMMRGFYMNLPKSLRRCSIY